MNKRILLIGDSNSFMVKAIANSLKSSGYEVVLSGVHKQDIEAISDKPDTVLFYLENVQFMADGLIYYREHTLPEDVRIVLIGADDDLQEAYFRIPKGRVTAEIKRPVNIKKLGEQIDGIFSQSIVDKKKILVIDDDGTMLRTLRQWLSEKYTVYMNNSGNSALTFLQTNSVDLILLDYEMPIMNGPMFYEKMKENPETSDIPIMFLTAKSDKDSVMTGVALHPENYLLKTMGPEELITAIDNFFKKREQA